MAISVPPSGDRRAYYDRLRPLQLAPLWESLRALLTPEPHTTSVPYAWRYAETRPLLLEAGQLISAEEAERRVLVLENPGLPGRSAITETLYAGIQLILPGEVARSHRHSPAALRFILEGHGAYTAVDGERADMAPGDVILTPSWTWHDHGSEGHGPTTWLDVLDLPAVISLGPIFLEHYDAPRFPARVPAGDGRHRYGANLLPVERQPGLNSPLFHYPYASSRAAVAAVGHAGPIDPVHGAKLEYVNPATGGAPMPTISMFLQWLPAGFRGRRWQTTEGIVFCATEGRGRAVIGGRTAQVINWREQDVFVVPCWTPFHLDCDTEAVLFSASDRTLQQKLGLWREATFD